MSIAKAAIVWWYKNNKGYYTFIDSGQLDVMHEIVDIAGCKHIGYGTSTAVSNILGKSKLWDKKLIQLYRGIGHGFVNCFTPSKLGVEWWNEFNDVR